MCNWFQANKLVFHIRKTKYMPIHSLHKIIALDSCVLQAEGEIIERVSNVNLGIVLDHHFNCNMHIVSFCKKLVTTCFMLFKCHQYFDVATLGTIYFAIFPSQLPYCIVAWGHTYDSYMKPLIVLQKHAIHFISNTNYTASTKPLFQQYQIMPLQQLINYKTTIMVQKSLKQSPSSLLALYAFTISKQEAVIAITS